jgi:hypothetical protein
MFFKNIVHLLGHHKPLIITYLDLAMLFTHPTLIHVFLMLLFIGKIVYPISPFPSLQVLKSNSKLCFKKPLIVMN